MSCNNLLSRVKKHNVGRRPSRDFLCDYANGINSDHLAIFAIVFSALIHDVDHCGVSNLQLMKEEQRMANLYKNKNIAEQNSVEIAWDLLLTDWFDELRNCLFSSQDEFLHFRQIIINSVLATDIFDKKINEIRKARWTKAFYSDTGASNLDAIDDLKASIVIEHVSVGSLSNE